MSGRAPSTALRSAHSSTTRAAPSTPSSQNATSWRGEYRITSQRSSGIAGQRLGIQRTSYGSGASSPPGQNGHTASGRFGRVWREETTKVVAPLRGSTLTVRSAPRSAGRRAR